jgi:glycosyltransferase involved in cell wall biosynthesis
VTHPWSGGAETYMHEIARRWAADGMDVAWLTQRHAGSQRNEVIDGIQIHRVGGRLTLYVRVPLAYLARMRGRYDIIVDCENGIPFFSPFFSRVPKVLVVHHVHQEIFRKQLPRQLRWLALWLEGSLMPRMYRQTQVVAVSKGTKADLAGLGFDPRRISVVTNGVVPPKLPETPRASHATLVCMGRLKPQKSVDVLIRSMPAIIEQIPDLHVDIVGQGPDRTRLERLAWSTGMAGHIRFHGYVRAEVRDQISAEAWVAVCPSAFEGWGVVCMEASARGLPVVASNVAGLREAVRDGETGILFPYGDDSALAEALISLLQDPERRASMGVAGKQWAARHTWAESSAGFATLLRSQVLTADSNAVLTYASWL